MRSRLSQQRRPPLLIAPTPQIATTSADAESAGRVGDRLQSELAAVLDAFPVEHRPVASMARWLGVSRPICHRTVAAARAAGGGVAALHKAPGVRGLAAFLSAARNQRVDPERLSAAEAAVSAYSSLLERHGGRKKMLLALDRAVRAPGHSSASPSDRGEEFDARLVAFEGARGLTQREYGTELALYVYGPSKRFRGRFDCTTALGLINVQRRQGAMPICPVTSSDTELFLGRREHALGPLNQPLGEAQRSVGLIREFCSSPAPRLVMRSQEGRMPILVEPGDDVRGPFDVVLGAIYEGSPHPAADEPRTQFCHILSDGPSRRLIMVVYLHRSLAAAAVASSGVFAKDPVGVVEFDHTGAPRVVLPRDRWYDRLPGSPAIEYLGLGTNRLHGSAYPRLAPLAEHLFQLRGWPADQFVGYRMSIEYPTWNTHHLMWFDFESPPSPQQQAATPI